MPVSDLMFLPGNYKKHAKEAIAGSMGDVGWWGTILVQKKTHNKKHWIIGGNGRAAEAISRGATELDCCILDVDDVNAKKIAVLDNETAAQSENDSAALLALIEEVGVANFPAAVINEEYTNDLKRLLEKAAGGGSGGGLGKEEPKPELAEKYQEKWKVEFGDRWQIGDHHLLIGDSLDQDLIFNFVGSPVDMIFTDPPWNVDYQGNVTTPRRTIKNDNLKDGFPMFLDGMVRTMRRCIKPGGMVYVCMAIQELDALMISMEKPEQGTKAEMFHWSSTIIWAKQTLVMLRKDYHSQYEAIWYGWDARAARMVPLDDRTHSDLWHIDRPTVSAEHPTMKPVELTAKAIFNSSKPGARILDVFAGSGSTMAGAQEHGRQCYSVDNEPINGAVILERGSLMGLTCRKVE